MAGFDLSRRHCMQWLLGGTALLASRRSFAQINSQNGALPDFTGPDANPYWNSIGPLVSYPQKVPLILLTDRPVQLETPRHYFFSALTPNAAHYVRWHLDGHPARVDLQQYRLSVEGAVARPQSLSLTDLMTRFTATSVVAVNQCSGNSRSKVVPRVAGSQWGHGAMACARWTGVRLRDVLNVAGIEKAAVAVQCIGMERGPGRMGSGAYQFAKSLYLDSDTIDSAILAYASNDEPLPLLNGFPLRLVVPGYFATYWVKALTTLRVLRNEDDNYWMKAAYRIPNTPAGSIRPDQVKDARIGRIPIGRMPVRALIVGPDGSSKIPLGMTVQVQGIALSGHGEIRRVDVSSDGGKTWETASLGPSIGAYAFRTWSWRWRPTRADRYVLAVRASDAAGHQQTDEPFWNPSGYGLPSVHRQEVTVGRAG